MTVEELLKQLKDEFINLNNEAKQCEKYRDGCRAVGLYKAALGWDLDRVRLLNKADEIRACINLIEKRVS